MACTVAEAFCGQACSVLISVLTCKGALVIRIALGCLYYKSPAIFHLFCKVPQVKNHLFPEKPLPLCKPAKYVQFDQEICSIQFNLFVRLSSISRNLTPIKNNNNKYPHAQIEYVWLDMLKGADEN